MPAPATVIELIERFRTNREAYKDVVHEDADKAAHDRMVALVERMLDLHKQLAAARSPDEKTHLDREIKSTDAEIDRLVYELYGLTEEETTIVEGTSPPRSQT